MSEETNIYQRLLDSGFTKQEIHTTIYKYIMYEIEQKKTYKKLSAFGKVKWHIRKYAGLIKYFFNRFIRDAAGQPFRP